MTDANILALALQHYRAAPKELPFPLSRMWAENRERMSRAIPTFQTAMEAVHWAQDNHNTDFDHRVAYDAALVTKKERLLKGRYPDGPDMQDSPFSRPETSQDGKSNILYWHLAALNACKTVGARSVLEIGGGYGALARLANKNGLSYCIVDMPESLFFAECYLGLNEIATRFPGDRWLPKSVLCCPIGRLSLVEFFAGVAAGVAVTQGSFQEMETIARGYWLGLIDGLGVYYLYSLNYESVEFPPTWQPIWETRNDELFTCDAVPGWREVMLRRLGGTL